MEAWYQKCIDEIDRYAKLYPRRMRDNDKIFINDIRSRVRVGLSLTQGQERYLLGIQSRMTEAVRIPRRR